MSKVRVILVFVGLATWFSRLSYANEELAVDLPGAAKMTFVLIEPGTFMMESPVEHQVTISQDFYLGKYELTQGQWEGVMSKRSWPLPKNPDNPAAGISWDDVHSFIHRLNEAAGDSLYRLPTEAEWEYACRAGMQTRWSFGDDGSQLGSYSWFWTNACNVAECYLHPVGAKLPNPWGLYDMYGNAWEWCQDRTGTDNSVLERVIRGGNYGTQGIDSGSREVWPQSASNEAIGARLVRMRPPNTVVNPQGWGQVKMDW